MKALLTSTLALAAALVAGTASADVTFYEHDNYGGRSFSAQRPVEDFRQFGFNDRASSVIVTGEDWEVCEHVAFGGRCMVLRPGNYPSLRAMDMNDRLSSARAIGREHGRGRGYAPLPMAGEIIFYEEEGFRGREFATRADVPSLREFGFNNRASSVVVLGERWEACERSEYRGGCVILRPGRYPNLAAMGINDSISSVRAVQPGARFDTGRYAPQPTPVYDWRRRPEERLHTVNVDSVRAVYAAAQQQRCWVEREQVSQPSRGDPNVGGAVVGGLIGGILGHQVGGGTGRDLATIGGAVAGAAIGANAGRDGSTTTTQNVQRCAAVPAQGRPDYWDVSYHFRGVEHHMQTSTPPGPTVLVNENGEPRS
jgi:uncharacterized protein YcfJ